MSQRLKLVDVYSPSSININYAGRSLLGPGTSPSFSLVSRVLGPTFPGKYNPQKKVFMLQYPGVCAMFPVKNLGNLQGGGMEKLQQANPMATRILVHMGKSCTERLQLPPLDSSSLYFEPVVVKINKGIRFAKRKRSLLFRRHTLQHVLSVIGTPDQIYVKELDSMRIHRPIDGKFGKTRGDYFLNYFSLGMDVLIDGMAHTFKKIILHTNMPATRNFNRYNRCNYQIMINSDEASANSEAKGDSSPLIESFNNTSASSSSLEKKGDGADKKNEGSFKALNGKAPAKNTKLISFHTRWEEVQRILGPGGRPMVYGGSPGLLDYPKPADKDDSKETTNTSPSGPMILGGASELNRLNPFKSTFFYAYSGIIFEVAPNNGHVSSVILFAAS